MAAMLEYKDLQLYQRALNSVIARSLYQQNDILKHAVSSPITATVRKTAACMHSLQMSSKGTWSLYSVRFQPYIHCKK